VPRREHIVHFPGRDGRAAIVADAESLLSAVRGSAGTHIVKDEQQR
jgi:carbamate kinase